MAVSRASCQGKGSRKEPNFPGELGTVGLCWLGENTNVTHSSRGRVLGESCPL